MDKMLTLLLAVLAIVLAIEVINTQVEKAYSLGYEQGFDACIEENNLYERYEEYEHRN